MTFIGWLQSFSARFPNVVRTRDLPCDVRHSETVLRRDIFLKSSNENYWVLIVFACHVH